MPSASMTSERQNSEWLHISPAGLLVPLNLHEIWEYRELLYLFFLRSIKSRNKQTALGWLWILIGPLVNMVLLSVIFGKLANTPTDGVPHPLFIYSALLPWSFFASVLSGTSSSLLSNRDIMKKVYFPRMIAPVLATLMALFNFLMSFVILLLLMLYYGYPVTLRIVFLPGFLALAALTGMSVGFWWASWVVHFRDLNNVLQYITKAWMYASPVVYASSAVPEKWRLLYRMNPMTNIIEGIRWSLLGIGDGPDRMLLYGMLIVLPVLVAGAYYFKRTERTIVDIA